MIKIRLLENNIVEKTKFIIYKLTNIKNNKIYIGQTITKIEERINRHYYMSYNKPKCLIDRSINKYGVDNFNCEIIEYCNDINELNKKEKYWILYYNSLIPEGYNISEGGNNKHLSESTKKLLSDINKGKKVSDETKQKIRESTIKEKNHFYGKKHTDDTKRKMSLFQKNKIISEESKHKMSISQKGRKHTEETKLKISLYNKDKYKKRIFYIYDLNLQLLKIAYNIKECSEYTNVNKRSIYNVISDKRILFNKYYIIPEENYAEDLLYYKTKIFI